jgi:hypothetical protein
MPESKCRVQSTEYRVQTSHGVSVCTKYNRLRELIASGFRVQCSETETVGNVEVEKKCEANRG